MKLAKFIAVCPLELNDSVKIVMNYPLKNNEAPELSERTYTVHDILATHSVKVGTVTFKVVLKSAEGLMLLPRNPSSVEIVNML